MQLIKSNHKILIATLICLSVLSFFLGFYFDENSAGAGGYKGDFPMIWENLQIYLRNDLYTAFNHPDYYDSRAPTAYIFHKFFNPFAGTQTGYRISVFVISLLLPILFYFCLKQKFKKEDNLLLVLVASIIFLSPYFRTTAYWGFEENYGLIFLLLSFLSLNSLLIKDYQKEYKTYFQIFLVTFFSSCCLYFDLKLTIIPLICFIKIITSNKFVKFKVFAFFIYFLFSLPYIYMIFSWGTLIPPAAAKATKLGEGVFFEHIGYLSTMIAFYFLPLLLFRKDGPKNLIKRFFLDKKNYFFISLFLIYLIYLLAFHQIEEQPFMGAGFIHKTALVLFDNYILQQIFTYLSFLVSWIIVLIYVGRNLQDGLILLYFFLISLIKWPIMQEYYDPLIILMAFTFFSSKLFVNYMNSKILFFYLSIFLICCNIYYFNLLG